MRRLIPLAFLLPVLAYAGAEASAQVEHDAFTWQGRIPAGRWLYVKNLNGPIRVEPTSGDQVVITADRRTQGDADPRQVRFVTKQAGDGQSMIVCALWGARSTHDRRRLSSRPPSHRQRQRRPPPRQLTRHPVARRTQAWV